MALKNSKSKDDLVISDKSINQNEILEPLPEEI